MTVTLCVLLWAVPGAEQSLVEYEDRVLALLPQHRGRLLQRVRSREPEPERGPYEMHIIEFADQAGYDSYRADPVRARYNDMREHAIARTEVHRVEIV